MITDEDFIEACVNGWVETVNSLIKGVSVYQLNQGLIIAANNGHSDLVRVILRIPEVDPISDEGDALLLSHLNGHSEIVTMLLADPRVDAENEIVREMIDFYGL